MSTEADREFWRARAALMRADPVRYAAHQAVLARGPNSLCCTVCGVRRNLPKCPDPDKYVCQPCRRERRSELERQCVEHGYKPSYWKLLSKRGVTLEEFVAVGTAQGWRCALCDWKPGEDGYKTLTLDHDHTTGKFRGLLCHPCNRGLGQLGDTSESVRRALDYLLRSEK